MQTRVFNKTSNLPLLAAKTLEGCLITHASLETWISFCYSPVGRGRGGDVRGGSDSFRRMLLAANIKPISRGLHVNRYLSADVIRGKVDVSRGGGTVVYRTA